MRQILYLGLVFLAALAFLGVAVEDWGLGRASRINLTGAGLLLWLLATLVRQ